MKKRGWLSIIRESKHLTQLQVAEAVGVSRTYYSDIENGKNPSGTVALAIANYLDFDMSLFFNCNDAVRVVNAAHDEQAASSA